MYQIGNKKTVLTVLFTFHSNGISR